MCRFESMLFKLEILDHKARERQAALVAMVGMPMPVVLSKEYVLEVYLLTVFTKSIPYLQYLCL